MGNSPLTVSIHTLDNDSLLHIFYLYRPFLLGEDGDQDYRLFGGEAGWERGRWWYELAHVCQRWRNVILGSASYLGVSLVCTKGTPVADMLSHSPPLPLIVDYQLDDVSEEDEEGVILALKQYNRVRRVRLQMNITSQQKFIMAMDDEYPILEYLIIGQPSEDKGLALVFPETLQAPLLHHLNLAGFALPVGSRLLTNAVGLVTLCIGIIHPSTFLHPNTLLQWLSFMPQLESLVIAFFYPVPNCDIERQLIHPPIMTAITLPNLHYFAFFGVRTYLEGLIHRIATPRLEKLDIQFFNQLTFSVPRLVQFVSAAENLILKSAKFKFSDKEVEVEVYPHEEAEMRAFSITVECFHLDWQVSSVAQIFNSLCLAFSEVEHLTLEHEVHRRSSEGHNEADPTEWRKLLSSFRNVKTLRIAEGLVEELSCCLQLDDGELPLELLPELQELTYSGSGNTGNVFTSFINARQDAGRPLTLVRRDPSPDRGSSVSSLESPSITPAGSEAGGDLDTDPQAVYPSPSLAPSPTSSHLLRRGVLAEDLAIPNIP